MRLSLDSDPRINLVRRYGPGVIVIGEQRITRPCIVTPQELLLDWSASSIGELSETDLEPLLARPGVLTARAPTAEEQQREKQHNEAGKDIQPRRPAILHPRTRRLVPYSGRSH